MGITGNLSYNGRALCLSFKSFKVLQTLVQKLTVFLNAATRSHYAKQVK